MNKKIIFIDMDGVLVDLQSNIDNLRLINKEYTLLDGDMIPNVFRDPPCITYCKEAIGKLIKCNKYELFIASTSPFNNPQACSDKLYWLQEHFGDVFKKRVFFTHRKDLLIGDYLIDDRTSNGAGDFKGEFIHFNTEKFRGWKEVVNYLLH